MKRNIAATLVLVSLLTGILAFGLEVRPASADNVTLLIDPPIVTQIPPIEPESFFDVFLNVSSVNDLYGFEIKVTWTDNTLITIDNATSLANLEALLSQVWTGGYFIAVHECSGGGGGGGYYRVAAVATSPSVGFSGDHSLMKLHFRVMRSCNFLLTTDITIDPLGAKLSDSAYSPIPVSAIFNGQFQMLETKPDLEFDRVEPDTHPWEYGKTFQIRVNVTHICANLEDYSLKIEYKAELLDLTGVDWAGSVLGVSEGESYIELPEGTINITDPGGTTWSGESGLLFTLTFQIKFDDRIEHIWRKNADQHLHAFVKLTDAELSFLEGTIPMSGITKPADLDIVANLIRGDVDCNGMVDITDLRTVAVFYDQITPTKYDLTIDGTIDLFDLVVVATNYHYGW